MALRRYFGKISPLQIGNLVGHNGELVIDETTDYVYIMDGVTPGGQQILYTNVNAAVSNIYANVNPSVNNYFTLGNVSNVWANAFIGNALVSTIGIGNTTIHWSNVTNRLVIDSDLKVNGNINLTGSEIVASSAQSTNFINTAAPGYNNGFSFSNGTTGDSGVFHTLDNANVIQVYLSANGNPFISAGGDGNGAIGFNNTIVNGNLTISGFSPYTTQIGFAPSFKPSNAKLTFADQVNSFVQFLIQNKSNGNNASTDFVATSNDGSDSTHYIDMGINSSTFNGGGGLDGPDDGYLLVEGGKLLIATIDQPNDIVFAVGGDAPSNEMGRFKYGNGFSVNGNLTVTGNLNVTGNIVTTNYETVSKTEYANSIVASGNITASGNLTAAYYVGNGYYLSSIISSYSNANVAAYLPTYSGNSNAAYHTGNGYYLSGITTSYGNANVASYLPTYSGNLNAAYHTGNGYYLTGIQTSYNNTNVAAYLPTYSGNMSAYKFISTAIPGYSNGFAFSNGVFGDSGVFHTLDSYNTIQVYLSANGKPFISAGGDGNGSVGFTNTIINGNLTISGFSPYTTQIGFAPTFVPSNAKLTYADQQNTYIQFLLQNKSNGNSASTDVVLTSNDGTETTHYIDLGINSSTFNAGGGLDGPDDGYLLVEGGKLLIATIDQPNDIVFAVGGDAPVNEIGRFKYGNGFIANGNVTTNGNIIPFGNAAYSLGSPTNQWKSLYVSNNTIYIAGTPVQVSNGSLFVNGNAAYSNSTVSAYLPTDSTIISLYSNAASQANLITTINANITAANSAISTVNANVVAANSAISTLISNAASQASDINTLYANAGSQANSLSTLNSTVVNLAGTVATIQAGSGFATIQQIQAANSSITTLNANLNAANLNITNIQSNIATIASNVNTLFTNVSGLATSINTLFTNAASQANDITVLYSNAASQATTLNTLISNSALQESEIALLNANVAAANSAIVTANSAVTTYATNLNATMTANIVSTNSRVTVLEGNVVSINNTLVGVINGAFSYSNANVATYLPTYSGALTAGNITASGNVSANFFTGNGYYLTGLSATYGNTQVAAYLPTYSGNVKAGNVQATTAVYANAYYWYNNGAPFSSSTYSNTNVGQYLPTATAITANLGNVITNSGVFYANGVSILFGIGGTYSNSNVVAYLPTYSGNSNASFFTGNGYYLTGITSGSTYSNTNVAAYLPTYAGNVNANFYLGNGYYLTGITGGGSTYSNTNVAAYLVTYNGNISAGNLSLSSGASGNISGTGYVTAGNMVANTNMYANGFYWYNNNATLASTITGTFANANVAGYLPTYTGNVGAGNIILTNLGNIIAATNSNLSIRTYGLYNIITLYGIGGGYNSPPYSNQSLTGGNGSGMTASYSSVGGYVSQASLVVTNPGTGYKNGDILSLPGGGSTVILSNYNQNITTSKAYNWTFSTYDGNITVPGNIIMPSNSYVLGDFTNSNVAYRTFFQTTTANATTGIYAAPTGTATGASWQAINTNTTNANNASKILIATNGNTDVQLISGVNGSGTYLPLSFYNNGAAQMVIYPNGSINTSNANPITTTGNVNAGYFVGNGSALTGIQANLQASNIYGTSSNVTIVAGTYSSVFSNVGMVTMPNVTVTGNTSVTGNITAGNVIATGTSGMQTRFLWDTWQANTNASLTSFTPSGSISGNASWDATQAYGLKLTPATNTQNGNIYWNSSTVNYNYDMVITASVGAGGGNGADGQYIFLGCSAVPTSQATNVGGIHVYNHYYSNQWEIYVAGTQYIIPFINEEASNYLPSGIRVWNATYVCFYNITVKIRKIQNGARMLEIYLNEAYQGSVNISSWSPAGNYFGVTGITGGSNSQHWVRQLRIDW